MVSCYDSYSARNSQNSLIILNYAECSAFFDISTT